MPMHRHAMLDLALQKESTAPAPTAPESLMHHSVLLAQSGSGKSFLLGRLLEELLLKTHAQLIVLDPNSDFIRIAQPDDTPWRDVAIRKWFYKDDTEELFASQWQGMPIIVASNYNLRGAHPLLLDWGSLTAHQMASVMDVDISREADVFWTIFLGAQFAEDTWRDDSEAYYDFDYFREQAGRVAAFITTGEGAELFKGNRLAATLRSAMAVQPSLRLTALVTRLAEYQIWRSKGDNHSDIRGFIRSRTPPRLLVVDLQSLQAEEEKTTVAEAVLRTLWEERRTQQWEALRDIGQADDRVPAFVVIDEAHNLVPSSTTSPASRALGDWILRIATEGRKYGIYLILATQRPRRISPDVLSECDNLLLMRMTNSEDLRFVAQTLGISEMDRIDLARQLGVGELLLFGPIATDSEVVHVSPRRTVQGGRGIPKLGWIKISPS